MGTTGRTGTANTTAVGAAGHSSCRSTRRYTTRWRWFGYGRSSS
jgi:hypothetical protein